MDFSLKELAKEVRPKEKKKEYRKMIRKHQKELRKDVKDIQPFDYGYGTKFFYDFLCYMRDYYKMGYNVWGEERNDVPMSRLEGIEAAIRELDLYYDENDEVQNKYYIRNPEISNEDFLPIRIDYGNWFVPVEPYKNMKEAMEAENKEKEEHYNKAFEIIKENLRYWWD